MSKKEKDNMKKTEKFDETIIKEKIAELEILKQSFDVKKNEAEENYSKFVRLTAEFDNFKKRLEKEKRDLIDYAHKEVLVDILPIIDSFEKAIMPQDEDNGEFRKGVEMIFNNLKQALKKHGLVKIYAVGEKFDPHFHEAIGVEENDDLDENTIIDELHAGYMIHQKVLRPAMVRISKKKKV
ncbi:nucleotide exchange factor GrpE [bacterium]